MHRSLPSLVLASLLLLTGTVAGAFADTASQPAMQGSGQKTSITDVLEPSELGTIVRLHTVDGVYLASQPQPADFAQAREDGVKTVISLRHESETEFDDMAVIEELGLGYVNLPFGAPDELTDEIFDQARELLKTIERPILLHCGSANRVGAVWLPYRVLDDGLSWDEALAEAKTVGLKTPAYEERAKHYIERHR